MCWFTYASSRSGGTQPTIPTSAVIDMRMSPGRTRVRCASALAGVDPLNVTKVEGDGVVLEIADSEEKRAGVGVVFGPTS